MKMVISIMGKYHVGGGIRRSLPLKQRTVKRIFKPDYFNTGYTWYDIEVDPHEPGNWHRARPTGIPHVAWAIYHLRRARLGQYRLF